MKSSNKNKKLLPLLVLAAVVVLLAIVLAVLSSGEEQSEQAGIPLCSLDAAVLRTIAYQNADTNVTLNKQDEVWTLQGDPALPLNQTTVESVAADIAAVQALRALSDEADVDGMGFDSPTMTLTLAGETDTFTLTVGANNAMTDSYYVKVNDSETVYTVATGDLTGLCKTPQALYQAQDITALQTAGLAAMTVSTGSETLQFTQTDGSWTLADDPAYSLDQSLVTRMANTVCNLQTEWSITAPQPDAAYGLDAPSVTVTLTAADGAAATCYFGATDPEDDSVCYLRADTAPAVVYEVAAENLSAFAYTKASLQAATPETAEETDADDIIAEHPVGGVDDYLDAE